MSNERWPAGKGPGQRRLPWRVRAKRWLVERAVKDERIRRIALNRINADYCAPGVLCLVPFADHKVFVDPRDDRIAFTILGGRPWQRAHLDAALQSAEAADRLRPGGVFVDVGANIGLITLYALLSGRFDRAVAIEPDPWNRSILERNLEINGLSERVTVLASAASDTAGSLPLYRDARNLGAHSLEPGFVLVPVEDGLNPGAATDDASSVASRGAGPHMVAVDTVDTLLRHACIAHSDVSFVKVDVEGHEFSVLAGMAGLLGERPPVMIEVTFEDHGGERECTELRRLMPGYQSVVDIGRPDKLQPVAFTAYRASGNQHELLIF